jgi:hypothetical protein
MVVIEFSKSNRAVCRTCNKFIDQDVMKLGTAKSNEGYLNMDWHHEDCFWNKRAAQYYKRKGKKINVLLKLSQFSGQHLLNPDQIKHIIFKINECNLKWGTKKALEKAGIEEPEMPSGSVATKTEPVVTLASKKRNAFDLTEDQQLDEAESKLTEDEETPLLSASGRVMRKKARK